MRKNMQKKAIEKTVAKKVTSVLDKCLQVDANSAACMLTYQPKAPEELKRYRRRK